jgi:hypothetical protein
MFIGGCNSPPPDEAALVIVNADIWTMDEEQPRASALAVAEGLLLAVGDSAAVDAYIGDNTRVLDLQGRTLVPGFNDAHMHPMMIEPGSVDLGPTSVSSMEDLIAALRTRAQQVPPGEWVSGWNYDETVLGGHPTRAQLDRASTTHPVMITHTSGHVRSANSLAYQGAGIDGDTPDPGGGGFDRDAHGEPSGVCREMPACLQLYSARYPMPERSLSGSVEQLRSVFAQLHRYGITSIGDAYVTPGLTLAYLLANDDEHPMRVNLMVIDESLGFAKWLDRLGFIGWLSDERLRSGTIKIFHGNSLSGHTTWLYEPYADRQDYYGVPPDRSQAELNALVKDIHDAGLQMAIHANGDREIDMVLDAIELALEDNPKPDHRHRIEHASVMNPAILARVKKLGVVLALHSYVYEHGAKMDAYGEQRYPWMHANRSALEAGVPLAGNSDYPVSAANVMIRLRSLMTRTSREGKVYGANQRLNVEQAIRIYTAGSAYASFEETRKGQLQPGYYADFAVLSANPAQVTAEAVSDIEVIMTVLGGRVVYEQALTD